MSSDISFPRQIKDDIFKAKNSLCFDVYINYVRKTLENRISILLYTMMSWALSCCDDTNNLTPPPKLKLTLQSLKKLVRYFTPLMTNFNVNKNKVYSLLPSASFVLMKAISTKQQRDSSQHKQ
jgi:hypothetical protein